MKYTDGNYVFKKTNTSQSEIVSFLDSIYNTKLISSKPIIQANGLDIATITATVFNYLDEEQTDYSGDITFELDGQQTTVQAMNGKASISFDSTIVGTFKIKTAISGFRNGEIEVTTI